MNPLFLGPLVDIAGKVLDRLFPDPAQKAAAQLELFKMQQTGELAELTASKDIALGQLEVNKAEAASSNWFASSWRPLTGYVFALALAWTYILRPVTLTLLGIFAPAHINDLPDIRLDDNLWQLMFGMLGLGGLRTLDKIKGKA